VHLCCSTQSNKYWIKIYKLQRLALLLMGRYGAILLLDLALEHIAGAL
jgi:hypothetical protein